MIVHAVECSSDCGNFYFCQGNYTKQGKKLIRQEGNVKTWECADYKKPAPEGTSKHIELRYGTRTTFNTFFLEMPGPV